MKLVAVVLNWNGGEDTLAALQSLAGIPAICVDNGSTDGSDRAVAERFPEVELLRTGANLGFAGGNNVGLERAFASCAASCAQGLRTSRALRVGGRALS